jgi:mRNA interferase MazF
MIEVLLTVDDVMPAACALNFARVTLAQRNRIGPVLCSLSDARWLEVRSALLVAHFGEIPRFSLTSLESL